MLKKLLAILVSRKETGMSLNLRKKMDLSSQRFQEKAAGESRLAKERHDQEMASRSQKYVSERTVPSDSEILGPSDSVAEKKD